MKNLDLKAGDCFLVHSHDWLAKAIDVVEEEFRSVLGGIK